ncbi:hypothetical protein GW7_02935 [Heterocephalus glaber]|uniref:Protein stum-like protein n=1 Tax=Heterocephalus glaber TaxID=10181 RepID=G5BAN5_HETGA|nr:hypothetical protein GW7_02935 [Heterocephalus glaber]
MPMLKCMWAAHLFPERLGALLPSFILQARGLQSAGLTASPSLQQQAGTFVSAFTVLCGARTDLPDRHVCCVFWLNIAAALIQVLTAVAMVGWIMSIFWGMDMVILARTFVSAFTVLCGARTDLPDRHVCCVFWLNIAAALIQVLTAVAMVGWIMSIFWGMDMVILARYKEHGTPQQL